MAPLGTAPPFKLTEHSTAAGALLAVLALAVQFIFDGIAESELVAKQVYITILEESN